MKKAVLSCIAAMTLVSTVAHASEYTCLGVDENNGLARVNTEVDPTQSIKPFGHVKGQEVRLMEDDGHLSLNIKKADGTMIIIVAMPGGLLFQDGTINLSCVKGR
ncbi:hypothetical protein DOM22_02630 [Bdellovibrio sp. ZAP7]|uniref:hypothetical protein n=1 Tax=Bdellovibrio sp. ZAP7 TaxID=2231053 RepID=UPI00115764AD|nr:hypothetical protein [Bdellovibrio sp. ZAP7]QDK44128.1 hypothetical protein DOM22_02630 [Bdellovibrio sp. ZAP7]